ncbi:alpha/beta hydrolase family protein [Niastella vici]|uniref:alpha/beta hydrolase family protein n=1 Tax=Niastella vici TaxID=1703345 RepID=UPI001C1FC2D8|nr:alpha/beta hydrolase [Niastella vici]
MKYSIAYILLLTVLHMSCTFVYGQTAPTYTGPIAKPIDGYGQDGVYTVATISFPSPAYKGKNVEVFYPRESIGPRPVIFYSHPFGGEQSAYNIGLFNFIAKKGYVVVFAPYATFGVSIEQRYNTLWQSFKTAVSLYPKLIDTTKVGFMGHSFGGGASFALAYKGFVEEGWGANGRFIFVQAPWYAYQITQQQLQSFPANTRLIAQVYDDDITNDHRIAIDMFKSIRIPDTEKDFILVKKTVVDNYTYTAEHNLPNTRSAYDAYDYYVVYRLLDALIDYSFNGNTNAKEVALGNGAASQVTLPGGLTPLIVTDTPVAAYAQSKYRFPCNKQWNPRANYCGDDAPATGRLRDRLGRWRSQ